MSVSTMSEYYICRNGNVCSKDIEDACSECYTKVMYSEEVFDEPERDE